MRDEDFEWDDEKVAANLAKHGVTFEQARLVFDDPSPFEGLDADNAGEYCLTNIGIAAGVLLHVTFTERGNRIRIISARKATGHERKKYHEGE